jgi:hypothetical protein
MDLFSFMDATSKAGWPARGRQKANDRKILFITQGGWVDAQGAARRVRGSEKCHHGDHSNPASKLIASKDVYP